MYLRRFHTFFLLFFLLQALLFASDGKEVFERYCWGCHHQTAMAFGPSFEAIASQRSAQEIEAMIVDPAGVSKLFGYRRNAMPTLPLTPIERQKITHYILSFKPKEL